MLVVLLPCLLAGGLTADPPLTADELRAAIRAGMEPVRSVACAYASESRWVSHPDLVPDPAQYHKVYQGSFLYRQDQSLFYDVYANTPSVDGSTTRRKAVLFAGKVDRAEGLFAVKQRIGGDTLRSTSGLLMNFDTYATVTSVFLIWDLQGVLKNFFHDLAIEGSEVIDGHPCWRVRVSILNGPQDKNLDQTQRRYWVDLARGAQVLRLDYLDRGRLVQRVDEVELAEYPAGKGITAWIPLRSRTQSFAFGADSYREPVNEQTFAIVADTLKLNVDLPDTVFNIQHDSAWPTIPELAPVANALGASPLVRQFRTQTEPPQPAAPAADPASSRRQVAANLIEANRRSPELQASSPARAGWNWLAVTQIGIGGLGVALLGLAVVQRWRGG